MGFNAYAGSMLAKMVREKNRMFFLDVDGCLATRGPTTPQELAARKEILRIAQMRAGVVFISARTPELMMSDESFRASIKNLKRFKSHTHLDTDGYRYLTDPPGIASFGCGIYVKNGSGYHVDHVFEASMGDKHWRPKTLALLRRILGRDVLLDALAPIDLAENYISGKSNVWPLPYRIQLNLRGKAGLAYRGMLRQELQKMRSKNFVNKLDGGLAANIEVLDESNISEERYTTYLTPTGAPKECMLDRMVSGVSEVNEMSPQDVSLFMIGDSLTDLRAGCLGGDKDAEATFFVPCDSELGNHLLGRQKDFAGVPIEWAHDNFAPTEERGRYRFTPAPGSKERTVIFGCEMFAGLTAPESVLACLEKYPC